MNRFDKAAAGWDAKERRVKLARDIADAVMKKVSIDRNMSVLDVGTGTGLILLSFYGKAGRLTGADSSLGMLDTLKEKAESAQIDIETLIFDAASDQLPVENYDLITSGMMLHHLEDVRIFFRKAHAALKKGGHFCAADLETEDGSFHDSSEGVRHYGFDKEFIRSAAEECGFINVSVEAVTSVAKERDGKVRLFPVFLLSAEK
ncbi:class I SAM-dependent methyltransferase [Geovibrio thiophilus]|uniref:Class I SAM-dependent methyltransferase n=1 Tax=Geovibrio thiophilus TaxID=139438 RepID=A0A410JWX3_9BACT|nr:class I SAM-dependent methyltransferase [Geovibrio thiophilus]QAR32548.1 class I SAM-dependent methyltransferase [Geovibrio thiophilus]